MYKLKINAGVERDIPVYIVCTQGAHIHTWRTSSRHGTCDWGGVQGGAEPTRGQYWWHRWRCRNCDRKTGYMIVSSWGDWKLSITNSHSERFVLFCSLRHRSQRMEKTQRDTEIRTEEIKKCGHIRSRIQMRVIHKTYKQSEWETLKYRKQYAFKSKSTSIHLKCQVIYCCS